MEAIKSFKDLVHQRDKKRLTYIYETYQIDSL